MDIQYWEIIQTSSRWLTTYPKLPFFFLSHAIVHGKARAPFRSIDSYCMYNCISCYLCHVESCLQLSSLDLQIGENNCPSGKTTREGSKPTLSLRAIRLQTSKARFDPRALKHKTSCPARLKHFNNISSPSLARLSCTTRSLPTDMRSQMLLWLGAKCGMLHWTQSFSPQQTTQPSLRKKYCMTKACMCETLLVYVKLY